MKGILRKLGLTITGLIVVVVVFLVGVIFSDKIKPALSNLPFLKNIIR